MNGFVGCPEQPSFNRGAAAQPKPLNLSYLDSSMSNKLFKLVDGISPAMVRAALKKKGRAYHNVKPLLHQIADKTSDENHATGRGTWWNQAHLAFFTGFTTHYIQEAEYAALALGMLKVSGSYMISNRYVLVEDAIKPFTVEIGNLNQPLENLETRDSSNTPNVGATLNVPGATPDVPDAAHTVCTADTQGVGKPKSEPEPLNPNGTANGWNDRQINIANTESLASLGSKGCEVSLQATTKDSESTEIGNQGVPVIGNESGSPVGKQPSQFRRPPPEARPDDLPAKVARLQAVHGVGDDRQEPERPRHLELPDQADEGYRRVRQNTL